MASIASQQQAGDSTPAVGASSPALPDATLAANPVGTPQAAKLPRPLPKIRSLTGVQILSVGGFAPETIVPNSELAHLGCDPEWILQRTGIAERRKASPEQSSSDLGAEAARICLANAGVDVSELDFIVVATMSPDSPSPSTGCRVQGLLGATCPAMDVSAACAGFMFALLTGMQIVKSGGGERVLVVGCETMTRTVDPRDIKTYPLFGDGAGAVLLAPGSNQQGLQAYELGSDASGIPLLNIPGGGSKEPLTSAGIEAGRQYLKMDGRAVFKWAVGQVTSSIRAILAESKITPDQVDHFVLHQANARILVAVAEALGVPVQKMAMNVSRYGNTSAASIPLVLDELSTAGELKPGSTIVMCGFGAGLAWGAGIFRF